MNICFSVGNLELGGAQMFVTRLASLLAKNAEHKVFIYDHQPELRNRHLARTIGEEVTLSSYSENKMFRWLTWKINGLLQKLSLRKDFRNTLNKKRFGKFLRHCKIDIVNSHASYSDFVCASAQFPDQCQLVITLHGEYELILNGSASDVNFGALIRNTLTKTKALIYTAEKNLLEVKKIGYGRRVIKIPVGIDRASLPSGTRPRSSLGLSATDFVAGMVGRGIPEKGWDQAIAAVQANNKNESGPMKLILIGDSEYLKDLVAKKADPNIILLTFASGLLDYYTCYDLFDVFIFPSYFAGESVPNVVIESLSKNVPVLATRYAEIPAMIGEGTEYPAGICVDPGSAVLPELITGLAELRRNTALRERLSKNCARAFEKFDLQKITNEYIEVFRIALNSTVSS